MDGVIYIGGIVVDTVNQMTAARVAKATERSGDVRGTVRVDGHPVRWSEVLAYEANGGFEPRRGHAHATPSIAGASKVLRRFISQEKPDVPHPQAR